jgi:hypothetical protein
MVVERGRDDVLAGVESGARSNMAHAATAATGTNTMATREARMEDLPGRATAIQDAQRGETICVRS